MTDYTRDLIKSRKATGYYPKPIRKQKVFCPKANGKIYKSSCVAEHNVCRFKQTEICIIRRSIKCKLTKTIIQGQEDFDYVKIAHCMHHCDKFDLELIICNLNHRYEKLCWEHYIESGCKYRSIDVCNWNPEKRNWKCTFRGCKRRGEAQQKHEKQLKEGK